MNARIVSLEAQNVKKLKAVRLELDKPMTIIGGNNGQGKTTVLDCIEMALGGKKSIPPRPIREGESSARIVLELDTLTVVRKFTAKDSYLEVLTKDGAKYPSAQAVLDDLYNSLSFDPVAFARMKPADQAATLRAVCGIDTADLDEEYQKVYTERTGVNRDVKTHEATVRGMVRHEDAPAEAVSITALTDEADAARSTIAAAKAEIERCHAQSRHLRSIDAEIDRLTAQIESLRRQRTVVVDDMPALGTQEQAEQVISTAEQALANIRAQIATAEQTNQKVRENAAHIQASERLTAAKVQAEALTLRLEEIEQAKLKRISEAQYPVPGLSIALDGTVLMNGIPFEQASGAEQIRVSAAIGLAMNPKLPLLLIRDGSLLDDNSMRMLAEFAEQHNAQILIERVGNGDPMAVVIEDGEIVVPADPLGVLPVTA